MSHDAGARRVPFMNPDRQPRRSPAQSAATTPILIAACTVLLFLPKAALPAALSSVRAQTFENENLLFYAPEPGDLFGFALATGDFNGDGAADLAAEHFLAYGNCIPAVDCDSARLGESLAVGDFDGDGHADLAIAAPYRDVGGIGSDVGRENVLYGALFSDGFFYGFPYYWSAIAP